jgi:Ca2+-binding EF-hand superfamily protein
MLAGEKSMSRWIRLFFAPTVLACAPHFVLADDAAAIDSAKLFSQLDANSDDAVAVDEVPADKQPLLRRLMRTADKNGDGRLSRDEFVAGLKGSEKATEENGASEKSSKANSDSKNDSKKDNAPAADKQGDRAARRARLAGGDGQALGALVSRMDKNGDGKVTPDEVPEERRDRFKTLLGRLDKNSDGALSKEEIAAAQPDRKPTNASKSDTASKVDGAKGSGGRDVKQIRERLKEADKNGDGKLSKEEMPERLAPMFGRLDKNNDGQVDKDELRAGLETMRERAALQEKQQKLNQQEKKIDAKRANNKRQAKVQAARQRLNKQSAKKAKAAKQDARRDNGGGQKNDADTNPA